MQIRRTWTTKHWCESAIEPEWPFAYSKYKEQKEETKGRVSWAVNGSHRYDFGGEHTTHVCMYMTQKFPCQSSSGRDYSNCPLRCWGYQKGLSGLNNTAGPTSHVNHNDPLGSLRNWPDSRMNSIAHVNVTTWTLPAPTAAWSYPKTDSRSLPLNPKISGRIPFLPQGFTFTLAGAANSKAGFTDGIHFEARYDDMPSVFDLNCALNVDGLHFSHVQYYAVLLCRILVT